MEQVVNGIPVHYQVEGTGSPLLVLHGTPMDHRGVKGVLEPIFGGRKGWSRIYIDLPGHGKTPGPAWIKNNDQILDFIIRFVDSVIPEENFAIIGESYGGYLARGIAYLAPARVQGLFLWCPATGVTSRKLPKPAVRIRDDRLAAELTSDMEREMFRYAVVQNRKVVDYARRYLIPGFQVADHGFIRRVADTKFSFDLEAARFEKPTAIACGRQDFVVGYDSAYKILDRYPMGTLVIVDGAGHALGITEGTTLFNASIVQWLQDMELYGAHEARLSVPV